MTFSASTNHANRQFDVGIFWDYENVRIPRWCRTADASNAIRSAVAGLPSFGHISERRLYYDSKKDTEKSTDRVNLDLSGFTLVDCPARGKKETLDKKMIVDILMFVSERAARTIPTCVVLITSDGDYSYTLARLRDIGVCTVVVYGARTTTADVLLDSCDFALSWIFDVLNMPTGEEDTKADPCSEFINTNAKVASGIATVTQKTTEEDDFSFENSAIQYTANISATHDVIMTGQESSGEGATSTVEALKGALMVPPLSRETSISEALDGRFLVFLNCVSAVQTHQLCRQQKDLNEESLGWEDCWAEDSKVAAMFHSKRGLTTDQSSSAKHYRLLRRSAQDGEFLQKGRKDARTGAIYQISEVDGKIILPYQVINNNVGDVDVHTALLPQMYLRLTKAGRAQLKLKR